MTTELVPDPHGPEADTASSTGWLERFEHLVGLAIVGVIVFVILFWVLGLTLITVMLLTGGILVALGDRFSRDLPQAVAKHRWNPFGSRLRLGDIGFGLL